MEFTDQQGDTVIFGEIRLLDDDVVAYVHCIDHDDGENAAVWITREDAGQIVRFLTKAVRNA